MRVVVIGAGLGGLAAALRLQHAGYDVTVVEGRERPGGRAYQLRDGGFTWDTGPSLITMPWVLEDTFAAGGLDLHREVVLRRLDPFYRIRWADEERALEFVPTARMPEQSREVGAEHARRHHGVGTWRRQSGGARRRRVRVAPAPTPPPAPAGITQHQRTRRAPPVRRIRQFYAAAAGSPSGIVEATSRAKLIGHANDCRGSSGPPLNRRWRL